VKNKRGLLPVTDQLRRVRRRIRGYQNGNPAAPDGSGSASGAAASAVADGGAAGGESLVRRAPLAEVVADNVGRSGGHDPGAGGGRA